MVRMENPRPPRPTYHIAVSDLDDTLLGTDGAVSPRTLAAIEAWMHAGNRFVIATGRPPRSIATHLPPLLHDVPWICYNGAEIRVCGEIVYQRYIPEFGVHALLHRLMDEAPETIIGIEVEDLLWLNRPRPTASGLNPNHRVGDLRTIAHVPTAKVLLFADDIGALVELIGPPPNGVRLMPSGRYPFVQLMARNADKATALLHLTRAWGVSLESVVAFGDDINDVELLREVGLGVAVANAYPRALEVADRVTTSNDEDGVAVVLEELLDRI